MEPCTHDWITTSFKISLGQEGIGHFDSSYSVDGNFAVRKCGKCGVVEIWFPDTKTHEWMTLEFILANSETPYMVFRKIYGVE